jgi:hypothetical protein
MDSIPVFALTLDPKDPNFKQRGCHLILQIWKEKLTEIQEFSMNQFGSL